MTGANASNERSRMADWLIAVWVALCAVLFTAPIVAAAFLPRQTWGFVVFVEELEAPGRCVYVAVIGLCILCAALRVTRRFSRTGGLSDS